MKDLYKPVFLQMEMMADEAVMRISIEDCY